MAFDVDGARKAGYSETEIADHLATQSKFDAPAARKAGYSDAEIIAHVRPAVTVFNAQPTDRQKLLASAQMRLAKGGKDPIDGAAQMLQRVLPSGVVNAVNKAADFVGGEGTFAGDVLGIKGMTPAQMTNDIASSNAEYEDARKATGQTGVDAVRIAGNILSPANAAVTRVVPLPGIAGSARSIAARGALGGAAGAVTQPVMGENFLAEKAGQVLVGAAAGGVLAPVVAKVAQGVGRGVDAVRRARQAPIVTPDSIRIDVRNALQADGVDVATIPDVVIDRLAADATAAVRRGQRLDAPAALRAQDFNALGLPYTRGQVTRDPAQWQKEFNIAGIEDAGLPVRNLLQSQSQGITRRFQQGSRAAAEPFEAGGTLIRELQGANATAEGNVRDAYRAFRESTGREMQVPMQGLAQDYAQTLQDFGETIPGAVRRQFEDLGLMSGTQRKLLSVEDAERLIKTINKNYNPADRAAANSLNELRGSVQRAITSAADGDGAGAEAAQLANEARGMAANRFRAIAETPALRAAIDNVEPDNFVRQFVIGGRVNDLERMQELLGPEGRNQVRAQAFRYLEQKAFGANAAGDGKAAQATFNNELNRIGRAKLVALLGEEGADEMQRVGRVLAYIKQTPEGATPNTSGTSQALLNALSKARGLSGLPYINDFVVKPIQGFADRRAATNALQNALTSRADLDPSTVNALSRYAAPLPVAGGVLGTQPIR